MQPIILFTTKLEEDNYSKKKIIIINESLGKGVARLFGAHVEIYIQQSHEAVSTAIVRRS